MAYGIWAVVFWMIWYGWSGVTSPLMLGYGLVWSVFSVAILRHLRLLNDNPFSGVKPLYSLYYGLWLVKAIILSIINVAGWMLRSHAHRQGGIIEVPRSTPSFIPTIVHAQSITVTPGTIALDTTPTHFRAHALHIPDQQALRKGEIDNHMKRLAHARDDD